MPRDKSLSHERIIRAAKDEFSEYGYDKASMRRIGERCGLTAAALYRHFENKEAMFDALVEPAMKDLRKWIDDHAAYSEAALRSDLADPESDAAKNILRPTEIDMMREVIYPRISEFAMLVNKTKGSRYENFMRDLIDDHQKRITPYFEILKSWGYNVRDVSPDELHMLITAYCTALFEPVVQNYSLEEAVRYLETVESFFMPGWRALLGIA